MLHDARRRPLIPRKAHPNRFTMTPNALLDHHAQLGIPVQEMACAVVILRHQFDERLPFPSENTIARALGRCVRQVRRYIAHLREKGLLRVVTRFDPRRGQTTNAYDLTPLLQAAQRLAEGHTAVGRVPDAAGLFGPDDVRGGRTVVSAQEEDPGKQDDYDAMPPTPISQLEQPRRMPLEQVMPCGSISTSSLVALPNTTPAAAPAPRRGLEQEHSDEAGAIDPVVAAAISALGQEFGDETPRSSVSRAHGIMNRAGLSAPEFLAALREAMARTRQYRAKVRTRRGSDGRPNLVPYTFAVLESLLRPAPVDPCQPWGGEGRRRHRTAQPAPQPLSATIAPPLPDEPHPIWRAVLEELRAIMTPVNFTRWFAPTQVLGQEGDLLRIAVPDEDHREWLDRRLRHQVEGTLRMIGHTGLRVAFVATV